MQLQKRVSLTLVPIISALIIILSFAIWSFIYDQVKRNEIERAWLSLEIILVDIQHSLTELGSALQQVSDYDEVFNLILEKDEYFREFALTSSFLEFSYQLNNQLPGFKLLSVLDTNTELLIQVSANDLVNFSPNSSSMDPDLAQTIKTLHQAMREGLITQGVAAFLQDGEIHLLASRIYSPHVREGADLAWSNEHFIINILLRPFSRHPHYETSRYEINLAAPGQIQNFNRNTTSIDHTRTISKDRLSASTPLFEITKTIDPRELRAQIREFTFILVLVSIALIFSLYWVVIRTLKKQVLLPITRLEQKVGRSVRTGVVDIQPGAGSNEVESLGNRYLDLMDQIYRLANIDSLTQLPNREQFLTSVSNTLKHQTNSGFVMFYLDLDRFKQVNDFYGHAEGDHLLSAFAKKLEEAIDLNLDSSSGRAALISRLAGDEFAVFVDANSLKQSLEEVAEDLVKKLDLEFETHQGILHLEASIGVACYPEHASSAESLVAAADEAMFEAKSRGRNRWEILSQDIVDKNNLKKSIQEAIEESISDDLFYLTYQPIFSTHSLELVAAEVLLRSTHPTLISVGTEAFINIAEKNGAIRRIDSLVVNLAMEKIAEVRAREPRVTFAINFSATELISPGFLDMLQNAVIKNNMPANAIELEITETQMTEFGHQAMDTLEKLHNMGFTVALDDFGTGYNSFAQLNSSFVSRLKIDRRFVEAINTSNRDANMANIILGTSKLYGLEVVAEGVETEQQLNYMKEHNCDYVQGYLLAKPMKWEEFSDFLDSH